MSTIKAMLRSRDVTGLDGARGKIHVWRPHVRTWGVSEANLRYWRKYLRHCWDISAAPAVSRRPPQWFGAPI